MTVTMTPEDFATPEDIHSARPDVPLQTIRRHLRDGRLPGAVMIGRSWVIPADVAEEYVRTYERYGRTDAGSDTPHPVSDPADPPKE